jgi:hypothetical protein
MKLDLTTKIKGFDGNPITFKDKELEVKDYIITALTFEGTKEVPHFLDGKQKLRNYQLGMKVMNNDSVELTAEDIVYLKEVGAKCLTILVYGQIVELLEPKEQEKQE